MRIGFKLAALSGALSMAMGGSAIAGNADLKFDGWTVDNGTIDHSTSSTCANANIDCQDILGDFGSATPGFKQLKVTDKTGATDVQYIMTIITDQDAGATGAQTAADLNFYDVSYVKMGNNTSNENGLKSQQVIKDVSGGTAFVSTTDINSGWAADAGIDPITISQSLGNDGDAQTASDNFSSVFQYASTVGADGKRNGFDMSIDQATGLDGTDLQIFALREKQGTKLVADPDPSSVTLPDQFTGGTATWASGDDLKSIWIGQKIDINNEPGVVADSYFGYVSYDNLSDNQFVISDYSLDGLADGSGWTTATGEATPELKLPCLADPSGASCP